MVCIGKNNLEKMFPDFKEDIQQQGIDLRIGKIYGRVVDSNKVYGSVNNEKKLPEIVELPVTKEGTYKLKPNSSYIVEIDRQISIPAGVYQHYKPRYTLIRCDVDLKTAIGDAGFTGTLQFGLTTGELPVTFGRNERIAQAITETTDGSEELYNGFYQEQKGQKKLDDYDE